MRKQSYFVIQELVSRELKRKYSRSRLGILWSVFKPSAFYGCSVSGLFCHVPKIH